MSCKALSSCSHCVMYVKVSALSLSLCVYFESLIAKVWKQVVFVLCFYIDRMWKRPLRWLAIQPSVKEAFENHSPLKLFILQPFLNVIDIAMRWHHLLHLVTISCKHCWSKPFLSEVSGLCKSKWQFQFFSSLVTRYLGGSNTKDYSTPGVSKCKPVSCKF